MRLHRSGLFAFLVALGLFFGMQLAIEVGRALGQREVALHGAAALTSVGGVASVVYSLLGLLVPRGIGMRKRARPVDIGSDHLAVDVTLWIPERARA